jgi:CRP-like cAMP-binding protein
MMFLGAESGNIFDRILDTATDNLRVAKILTQMGLDPNNVTYDSIFNRLFDIFLSNINLANLFALIGATFLVATLLTRTMVPLRIANIIGNVFFAGYGALAGDVRTLLLYALMVPINALRLNQMVSLVKKARVASQGDLSMEWLKPFMAQRKFKKGDILCRKGDEATEMYLVVTGKFLITEIAVELLPGKLMGELGFLTPNNRRTFGMECIEDGQVLSITYEKLLEVYFQNPQFGYYFMSLTTQRLLENNARLEATVAQYQKAEEARASGERVA